MLINGEKYACEACVRGHRVSSCTHSDRKLLHVNKKGRPVSQCQHCRSLRKARSSHVKCECHDKAHAREDCPHLKNENGSSVENIVPAPAQGSSDMEPHTCCCGHGARCTCALKKESNFDTAPGDFSHLLQPKELHKSRISSLNNHEGKPTVFSNGHHKPVHKINDAHNHCGLPYKVPSRSHTANGHRELAERSTDSLPLLKQAPRHHESPLHNSITSAPREIRQTKSEHGSPVLGPMNPVTSGLINELYIPPLSPNAYSYSPFRSDSPNMHPNNQQENHLPENIPDSWFTTYDEAHAMDAMPVTGYNDVPPVDWSTFDFTDVNGGYPQNGYISSQNPSYAASFDQPILPGMHRLNSSSGDVSEVEDSHTISNRPSNLRTVSNASNDVNSSHEDDLSENYRLSSASSLFGTPQANMLAGNLNNLDIDEYVKQTVDQQRRITSQPQPQTQQSQNIATPPIIRQSSMLTQSPQNIHLSPSPQHKSPSIDQTDKLNSQAHETRNESVDKGFARSNNSFGGEHALTISEAQAYAHMGMNQEIENPNPESPVAPMVEDPMWCGTPADASAFVLDDEREDEDWVR